MTKSAGHDLTEKRSTWAIKGIFLIMLFGSLTVAQSFFVPTISAIVLALIFSPVRRFFGRLGISSTLSAALIASGIVLMIAVSVFYLSGTVQGRIEKLPQLIPNVIEKFEAVSGAVEPVVEVAETIDEINGNSKGTQEVVVRETGMISSIAQTTPRLLGQISFTLALMIFLIASGDLFYEKIVRVMPNFKDKRKAVSVVKAIEERVSLYFFTITVINAIVAAIIGVVFWALGMPDPIFFGLSAFVLNFIPYAGPIFGEALAFLVAVLTFDSLLFAFLPPLAYFLITMAEGQFITPVLVGRRLKFNAVIVFLSVAIGAWMWSLAGMLLAVPILIVIKEISKEVDSLSELGWFLGNEGATTKSEQRILDQAL